MDELHLPPMETPIPGGKKRVQVKKGLWIEIGEDEDSEKAVEKFRKKLESTVSTHKGRELQKKNHELSQITGNKKN